MMRRCALVIALVAWHGAARAEVEWAVGVAKEDQRKANELFAEGNELFAQQAHALALDKYRAAIALWDHPLIRFNMAVTLVRLDRLVEAAESLDKALRFGAAPFPEPDQYQQALDYQRLVAGRVGTIEVTCDQPDTEVLLDGAAWLSCPGKRSAHVLAGPHLVVAERAGYLTLSRRVFVTGGATARERVELMPLDALELEYPTPRWVPWSVTAAGAAIALGGVGFWVSGNNQMSRFESDADVLCRPHGCSANFDANPTERQLAAQRDSAELKGAIAIAMFGVGGAVTVGGVVWTILNRPRRVAPSFEVTPTAGGASARVGWRF